MYCLHHQLKLIFPTATERVKRIGYGHTSNERLAARAPVQDGDRAERALCPLSAIRHAR